MTKPSALTATETAAVVAHLDSALDSINRYSSPETKKWGKVLASARKKLAK